MCVCLCVFACLYVSVCWGDRTCSPSPFIRLIALYWYGMFFRFKAVYILGDNNPSQRFSLSSTSLLDSHEIFHKPHPPSTHPILATDSIAIPPRKALSPMRTRHEHEERKYENNTASPVAIFPDRMSDF